MGEHRDTLRNAMWAAVLDACKARGIPSNADERHALEKLQLRVGEHASALAHVIDDPQTALEKPTSVLASTSYDYTNRSLLVDLQALIGKKPRLA